MKRNSKSLILALWIAAMAAATSLPAQARSTTAYASFHVQNASETYYGCLVEDYGAVVNECSTSVSLVFDMPIANTGSHWVTIKDYWIMLGDPPTPFNCESFAYDGNGPSVVGDSGPHIFSFPQQTITEYVNVPANGDVMQLICWNVPVGSGIATINWSD
jgi:hypothetical protein